MGELSVYERAVEASKIVAEKSGFGANKIEAAIILGSGLGSIAEQIVDAKTFLYSEILNMPVSKVSGHAGVLHVGKMNNVPTMVFSGRVHLYEGWKPEDVAFNVRLAQALGVKTIIITNAAGGINVRFESGDLMLVTDHINLTGLSPLAGPDDERLGKRFPDQSKIYSPLSIECAREYAGQFDIHLQRGVLAARLGPEFETPTEVKMLRTMGAQAVGMSIMEAIAANQAGMRILGITVIANPAAGITDEPIDHEDVKRQVEKAAIKIARFLPRAMPALTSWASR